MSAFDDLPTFPAEEIPDLCESIAYHLAHGELPVIIADGPVIARELPVVENLGKRQIGRALLCRVRFGNRTVGYTVRLYVRVRITDDGVRAHLRAQGPSPGTVTEICRDGILTGISVNTGGYRAALSEAEYGQ